jgi:hypothetical protein
VLAAEQPGQLERGHLALDLRDLLLQLAERVVVALLGELQEDLRLVGALALALPARDRVEDGGGLAPDGLRLLGVAPEPGGGGLLAQLRGAPLEARQVKDASRAP